MMPLDGNTHAGVDGCRQTLELVLHTHVTTIFPGRAPDIELSQTGNPGCHRFWVMPNGCVVVKKSIWANYNSEMYYNSFFGHFSNIFNSQDQITIYTQKKPFINCRIDAESWSSKHLLLWHFYYPQFKNMIYNKFTSLDRSEIVSHIPFKILFKYYALGLLDDLSNIKVSIQLRNKLNRLFLINKKVAIILCLIHTYFKNNKILRYKLLKRI